MNTDRRCCMDAIFSSKLYRASRRKNKIRSAISNPINMELVTQLRSYLDEDELRPDPEINPDAQSEVDVPEDSGLENTSQNSNTSSTPHGSGGFHPSSSDSDSLSDEFVEDKLDTVPDDEGNDVPPAEPSDDSTADSVDEAVDINNPHQAPEAVFGEIPDDSEILFKLTTSCEGCEGVRRVSSKGNELWVYYNDDTNLNTVMECTITSVCDMCKDCEFNRLARTDNAVVFQRSDG